MNEEAPLIVSISGIRGLVDRSLTLDVVYRYAAAFATVLPEGATVVVARDTRPSGPALAEHATRAFIEAGCRVIDLGVCSTPGAKLMVTELGAAGAIIVTASHNPLPWNGLKLIRDDGIFLNAEQGGQVEAALASGRLRRAPGGSHQELDQAAVNARHLARLLAHVDVDLIRSARLRAAIDPCNGTGSVLLPELLDCLGVQAVMINGEPDGCFAHEPEPLPENLVQLGDAVRNHGTDVGFAVDPDADRVALVDEAGRPVGEDYTLALAVREVTTRTPGRVVTTLSTSQTVTDAATGNGCEVVLTPVGEVHVVEKMLEVDAVVGGEGNGGVILTQIDPGRDAAVGVAVILEAMARARQPLSCLAASLPRYAIDKRKVAATAEQLRQAVAALQRRHPHAYLHPVDDGAKLYLEGGFHCPWVHLRASNTEPVVRVIAESADPAEAVRLGAETAMLLVADA
jgi:phosphomannomutase